MLGLFHDMTYADVNQVVQAASASEKSSKGKRKGQSKKKDAEKHTDDELQQSAQALEIDDIIGEDMNK